MARSKIVLFIVALVLLMASGVEAGSSYMIEVSISKCRLWLYEVTGGERRLVKEYEIGAPKKSVAEYLLGEGSITAIEFKPWWFPTANTRDYYLKKKKVGLPERIPPGDKLNAMGTFKIILSYCTKSYGCNYRIHGTNEPKKIGQRVSRGCIRMRNSEGEELARLVSVGTPVVIVP